MVKTLFLTAVLLAPSLAYGDASVPLSISVIPASATCQLGNHGLVRGRPKIAHGTVVADDGCLLVGGGGVYLYQNGAFVSADGYNDLPSWQATHDIDHFNVTHWYNYLLNGQSSPPNFYLPIGQIETYLDAAVSNANKTGMYMIINCDTKNAPGFGYSDGRLGFL